MTLTELRTLKAQILAAISNVLKNQTYTYANLATLRQWLKDVDKDIERASSTRQGMRIRRVIPRSD
jgi:hypothetical protein